MALQGLATFPGIQQIIAAEFTLSHGISPSVGTITTTPHSKFIAQLGDFVFTFGNVKITFKDCALDVASLTADESGQQWTINVMDRRWKWLNESGGGDISGHWNRRLPNGEIDPDFQKTPQELAKLLFKAMGETRFDVAQLPNKPRPEVQWDYDNPSQALANLCDTLSCRVVLGIDDKVYLRQIGKGRQLPNDGRVAQGGFGFDTSVKPSKIKVLGGVKRYENRFELEAIGEETDGSIKLIDKLSYKPAGGWAKAEPGFFAGITTTYKKDGETLQAADLARKTVWKWYRIKNIVGKPAGEFTPEGVKDKVTDLEDILPLGPGLIETEADPDGTKRPKPYEIVGQWVRFGYDGEAVPLGSIYKGGFSVDAAKGIVRFSNPVYLLDDTRNPKEPTLYLRTSHGIKVDGIPQRFTQNRDVPGGKASKTKARILRHDEIDNTFRQLYGPKVNKRSKLELNTPEVVKEANHWIDAALKEYAIEPSVSFEYAGIVKIQPDGAIQQVSWRVGGGQPAVTNASRNQEYDVYTPSWKERRRAEKNAALEAGAAKAAALIGKAVNSVGRILGI